MKQSLTEVKRLQKIAGLLNENVAQMGNDKESVFMVARALDQEKRSGKELSYQGKKIINTASEGFYVEDGSKRGQFVNLNDILPQAIDDIMVDGQPLEVDPEIHSTAASHKNLDKIMKAKQGALYRGDDDDYGVGPGSRLD